MIVELGGGRSPDPAADIVIDLHHPLNAPAQDATVTPWRSHDDGLPDQCADEVRCSHFLEHIPAGQARLDVFAEVWRILRPGGVFSLTVPLVGYTHDWPGIGNRWGGSHYLVADPRTYADPTHVSSWWFPQSLLYFTGDEPMNADYGAPVFSLDGWEVQDGWVGHARLVK